MKNIEKLINECIKMEQSVVNDVFKVDVFKCKKEFEYYKQEQALQLQQTGVMRSACKHDEENDTKAYAKNGNEFIGYYCEKCDTVYCGSI